MKITTTRRCIIDKYYQNQVEIRRNKNESKNKIFGGARGVMVIVVGLGHETDCISHSTNTFRKGMNPIIIPPAMGK